MRVMVLAVLLGQCTGAEAVCELPQGLPWWLNLAFLILWLAGVWGVVLLVRRRLAHRRATRRERRKEPGDELELW